MSAKPLLAVLTAAALAFSMAQTATVPAVTTMAYALDASTSDVTWTLTANLVAVAVCTPIVGRLGDMFGKRRLLIVALLAFAAGSVLAAASDSLTLIIAGRIVQGVGGGIFPLCFGIVRDALPRALVPRGIAVVASVLGLGGAGGLIMGGLLVDHASWEWIFWVGAGTAIPVAVAVALWAPESASRDPGRVDVAGSALLVAGLVPVLVGIAQSEAWGLLDARTLGLVLGGSATLLLWVRFEGRVADPLVDVRALLSPAIARTNAVTFLIGFDLFGAFILITQVAQDPQTGLGLAATEAGLLMVPGCVAMLLSGSLAPAIAHRLGPGAPLITGAGLTAAGLTLVGVAHGTGTLLLVWTIVTLAGLGLALAAIPNLIVDAVGPGRTAEATGVNVLVRSVGSSVGSAVIAAILAVSITAADPLPSAESYAASLLACAVVGLAAAVIAGWSSRTTGS